MTYIILTTYIVLRTPMRHITYLCFIHHLLWTGICYRVIPFSFCYWWVLWLFMFFHWYRFALLRSTRTSIALRNAHPFLKACFLFELMRELHWNLCALNGECENKDSGIISEVSEESMHEQTYTPSALDIENRKPSHTTKVVVLHILWNFIQFAGERCELCWYDSWDRDRDACCMHIWAINGETSIHSLLMFHIKSTRNKPNSN